MGNAGTGEPAQLSLTLIAVLPIPSNARRGDFRAPDFLRFGFAPLYNRYVEVWEAVGHLASIMEKSEWREARFEARAAIP